MGQRPKGWVLVALAVTLALQLSSKARAQQAPTASDEPPQYVELIESGLKEFDARDFPEARALFLKAHALYPNARTLRALGMVEFELREYPQSIEYLRQSLDSTVKVLTSEQRAQVQELLGRAQTFVAKVRVDIEPQGAKPQVLLDGSPVKVAPGGSLLVQVGEHVLEARADGYRPEKRMLNIKGGEEQALRITLNREVLQPVAAAAPPKREPQPLYKSPWLWTGVGVVAAGTAVALVLLLQPAAKTEVSSPETTMQTPPGVEIRAAGGRF